MRTDEEDAGRGAGFGEFGAFGEKTIARVDGIGSGFLGDADHFFNGKIAFERSELLAVAAPDLIGLVGLEAVQRQLVFFGVDRDGCDPEFGRGAKNSDRNFRPVGNEKATDHGSLFG